MEDHPLESIAEEISNRHARELQELIIEEDQLRFCLSTEAGLLGIHVGLTIQEEVISHVAFYVTFLYLKDEDCLSLSLNNTSVEGYLALNELQCSLVLSRLELRDINGTLQPILSRVDPINAENPLNEEILDFLMEITAEIRQEGVRIFPVLAVLSSGNTIRIEDISAVTTFAEGTLQ